MPDLEHPSHESYVASQRREVARVASGILGGSISAIEGARWLAGLRHEVEVSDDDEDFLLFVSVASQTENLPIGEQRKLWQSDSLARMDSEVADAEKWARDETAAACRSLVRRFGAD
jgi:hypothetical protein